MYFALSCAKPTARLFTKTTKEEHRGMTAEALRSKEQILRRFRELQKEHKVQEAYVSTKAEEAEAAEDLKVVKQALTYTVESVVNGLAALQLKFQGELDVISETLSGESGKLTELKRAIEVEQTRAAELESIRVAAEAIALLNQDQAMRSADFEALAEETRKAFEADVADLRAAWEREQAEFKLAVAEYEATLEKTRKTEEEEFGYEQERKHKIDADRFATEIKLQDRALEEEEALKKADWAEREAELKKHAEEIAEMEAEDEGFAAKLAQAKADAEGKAIRKAEAEAKAEAELAAKEFEADVKVFEQEIASLNETLAAQQARIETLMAELKVASAEEQKLAVKAIDNTKR